MYHVERFDADRLHNNLGSLSYVAVAGEEAGRVSVTLRQQMVSAAPIKLH